MLYFQDQLYDLSNHKVSMNRPAYLSTEYDKYVIRYLNKCSRSSEFIKYDNFLYW